MVFTGQAMTFAILETKDFNPYSIRQAEVMKTQKYRHGLSLIEILMAVIIIAMLATMVITVASSVDNHSKEEGTKAVFSILETALQEYYDYWKSFPKPAAPSYPNTSAALYGQLNATPGAREILERINEKLIQNNPVSTDKSQICDPWGTVIDYRYTPDDTFPELVSAGPDRVLGNADDISSK
jgi:prepilin-type N-terminal cleavage/methylation domain-containing protein